MEEEEEELGRHAAKFGWVCTAHGRPWPNQFAKLTPGIQTPRPALVGGCIPWDTYPHGEVILLVCIRNECALDACRDGEGRLAKAKLEDGPCRVLAHNLATLLVNGHCGGASHAAHSEAQILLQVMHGDVGVRGVCVCVVVWVCLCGSITLGRGMHRLKPSTTAAQNARPADNEPAAQNEVSS